MQRNEPSNQETPFIHTLRSGCTLIILSLVLFSALSLQSQTDGTEFIREYLDNWVEFYPSKAFSLGIVESAAGFEDFSPEKIAAWLELNRKIRTEIEKNRASLSPDGRAWYEGISRPRSKGGKSKRRTKHRRSSTPNSSRAPSLQ